MNLFIYLWMDTYQSSAALSAFFTLVGTHGLHVSIGLVWMIVLMIQLLLYGLNPQSNASFNLFRFILGIFRYCLDIRVYDCLSDGGNLMSFQKHYIPKWKWKKIIKSIHGRVYFMFSIYIICIWYCSTRVVCCIATLYRISIACIVAIVYSVVCF